MTTSQESIITGIAAVIEEVIGIDPGEVTIEKSFSQDLDIDSLSLVEIAVQLERRYHLEIPDQQFAALRTVGEAVAYMHRLENQKPRLATEPGEPHQRWFRDLSISWAASPLTNAGSPT
ncbi:acyl carrier protein [Nocardia yamanashiensis]|uniref:acyl carrier protein n=1 Tax=Nocardia yamanashiensis TaxID=209247 RepID=UPI001E433136|nr:acyl carrier protein [Nocardia yamanashiensis]UGT43315.1 acyl carrier protein [Nocardia yamanashiensis]